MARPSNLDPNLIERFNTYKFSPEDLYWVGFIFGDGNLNKSKLVKVVVTETDKAHLENMKLWAGSKAKVGIHSNKDGWGKPVAYFTFGASAIYDVLLDLGIVTPSHHRTPHSCLANSADFWRGLIDSDGWLGLYRTYILGLTANRETLELFQAFFGVKYAISGNNGSQIFKTELAGDNARKAVQQLYRNPVAALERKLAIAQEWY